MLVDLPCYSAPEVQDDFRNKIWKNCEKMKSSIENTEIVKILAPLTNNPNAPNKNTEIQILCEAINEYTGIVKILAP